MILITIKESCHRHKQASLETYNIFEYNKIFSVYDNYISSVEYINNQLNEILIKIIGNYRIEYRDLENRWHNPIGEPAVQFNDIYKEYHIEGIFIFPQEYEKAINNYRFRKNK